MEPELIFMTACLIFCGLLIAWVLMIGPLGKRTLLGISGTLLSGLVMGAFWQAGQLGWVGLLLKPILGVWLGAALLCGFAIGSGQGKERGVRVSAAVLGAVGLLAHAVAMITFMWMAAMGV